MKSHKYLKLSATTVVRSLLKLVNYTQKCLNQNQVLDFPKTQHDPQDIPHQSMKYSSRGLQTSQFPGKVVTV